MKLKKQIFLPILLSLSVFFSSTVMLSASAYAAVTPQVATVMELAEAAPNNTEIPKVEKERQGNAGKPGTGRSSRDSSFFEDVIEKIAVMFLLYMFLEAIQSILDEFFNGGGKIKITPKEKQDAPGQKGTKQNKNTQRIPAQDV